LRYNSTQIALFITSFSSHPQSFSVLKRFIETLESHVARIENMYYIADAGKSRSPKQHEELISALQKHDLAAACAVVRKNWVNTLIC